MMYEFRKGGKNIIDHATKQRQEDRTRKSGTKRAEQDETTVQEEQVWQQQRFSILAYSCDNLLSKSKQHHRTGGFSPYLCSSLVVYW